jgi:isopentenyldiphosphate isomerase
MNSPALEEHIVLLDQGGVATGRAPLNIQDLTELDLTLVLPGFTYRAVDTSGVIEHEWCPVVAVRPTRPPHISFRPSEVAAVKWHTWPEFDI